MHYGEKVVFFSYAPDAVVYEHVLPHRTNVRWIAARRYRAGQHYAMMFRDFERMKYWKVALTAPLKIGACVGVSAMLRIEPVPRDVVVNARNLSSRCA